MKSFSTRIAEIQRNIEALNPQTFMAAARIINRTRYRSVYDWDEDELSVAIREALIRDWLLAMYETGSPFTWNFDAGPRPDTGLLAFPRPEDVLEGPGYGNLPPLPDYSHVADDNGRV